MNNLKIKAFIKPKFDKHNSFDYGGFDMGEGTPYKIVSINFNRQFITVHEPKWIDYMGFSVNIEQGRTAFGYCGYTTNDYSFDDIEIQSIDIDGNTLSESEMQSMRDIAENEIRLMNEY